MEMNAQVPYIRMVGIYEIRYVSTVTYSSSAMSFAFMTPPQHAQIPIDEKVPSSFGFLPFNDHYVACAEIAE